MPGAVLDPFLALMYFILVAHNKMGKLSQLQMRNLRHRLNDSPKLGSSPEVVAEAVIETSCNTAFRLLSQPQLWACGLIFDLVPKSQCSNVGCNLGLKWLPLWKGAENAGRLQVPASDMCNTALVFFPIFLNPVSWASVQVSGWRGSSSSSRPRSAVINYRTPAPQGLVTSWMTLWRKSILWTGSPLQILAQGMGPSFMSLKRWVNSKSHLLC